ncbi:MAG: dihydropteroate synthase [Planctomycetaceae bacterium]|nr:dihydropteroate synthase [Planctomycetaceae bacterium]
MKLRTKIEWSRGRLDFSRGAILMGILNVTPDSFSDGGLYLDIDAAVEHGIQMANSGAAIIDIGAESTRPGSQPVAPQEQIRRAVPVIRALARSVNIPISIDTTDPETAAAAIKAGAGILNDITALAHPAMVNLAAKEGVPVILMHMQGTPATMQKHPVYTDVTRDVCKFLLERAKNVESSGVPREHIFLDPGIGFGKTMDHNLQLLNKLDVLCASGYRVLAGPSRKGFIGKLTGRVSASQRDFGTAAAVAISIARGASIVRVHNVEGMSDAAAVANAIVRAERTAKAES